MSLGYSKTAWWGAWLCLALCGLPLRHALAQGTARSRRSIELSETNSAEILTNLNQLTTKNDGLRQLEDQLRSFNRFNGPKSLQQRFNAPYVPPTTTTIPAKTIKELLDRQNNWGLTPEEMGTGLRSTDDDLLSNFQDDQSGSKKSSLQQFYDALNQRGASRQRTDRFGTKDSSNNDQPSNSRPEDLTTFSDDSDLPAGLRDKAKKLKTLINEDPSSIFNPARSHSSFDNFFGVNEHNNNSAANAGGMPKTQVDSFLDQFKKALDGSAGLSKMDPGLQSLLPGTATPKPTAVSGSGSDPLGGFARHDTPASSLANPNVALDHITLPDVNATVLNHWNPMYRPAPPNLEVPKYTPPTPLNMEFPRRKF